MWRDDTPCGVRVRSQCITHIHTHTQVVFCIVFCAQRTRMRLLVLRPIRGRDDGNRRPGLPTRGVTIKQPEFVEISSIIEVPSCVLHVCVYVSSCDIFAMRVRAHNYMTAPCWCIDSHIICPYVARAPNNVYMIPMVHNSILYAMGGMLNAKRPWVEMKLRHCTYYCA